MFQLFIFSRNESTLFDDVIGLDAVFSEMQIFHLLKRNEGVVIQYSSFTSHFLNDEARPVSIHTMRIDIQFPMDVPHQNDATSQTESQAQQVDKGV